MKNTSMLFLFIVVLIITVIINPVQSQILIDFGSAPGSNVFGLSGWENLSVSPNLRYTSSGPGGVYVSTNFDEYTDFMCIQGNKRNFQKGERIVATWYNNSDETIVFTSRISFVDSDFPEGGSSDGIWFTMRQFDDYRYTYTIAEPYTTVRTMFNIVSAGVHKSDGNHSVVNINLHIEWGSSEMKQYLICDKIELLSDADITPPNIPTGLRISNLTSNSVRLDWEEASDNTGTVEYYIYLDGVIEGYTRSNRYIVRNLQSGRDHAFTVSALDRNGNESGKSSSISITTERLNESNLINPDGFEYRGCFLLPEEVDWGGEALTFNPDGDMGGPNDGYPGSVFTMNLNQHEAGFVGELSIPVPKITGDIEQLNIASILQPFTNIRPGNIQSWDYVDVWRTGLCYYSAERSGGTPYLYSSWAFHYQVSGEKPVSISCCTADNLVSTRKSGAWYLGAEDSGPIGAMANDYMFALPKSYADKISGFSIVTGRFRDGGLSGLGPTLYAIRPVDHSSPPSPGSVLGFRTLLEYGPVEGTDNYNYPNSLNGYKHSDFWRGADWIEAGSQKAVAIVGKKGLGHNWYGYRGEGMHHDWVIADVPYPDFSVTDPDGKSWMSNNFDAMFLLYDPDDFEKVSNREIDPWVPQPYAVFRPDESIFHGDHYEITGCAFDAANNLFYILEFNPPFTGQCFLHVWKINEVAVSVDKPEIVRNELIVYPNPAKGMISFNLPENHGIIVYEIFDLLGAKVLSGKYFENNEIDISSLSSGSYIINIITGNNQYTGRFEK